VQLGCGCGEGGGGVAGIGGVGAAVGAAVGAEDAVRGSPWRLGTDVHAARCTYGAA